MITSRRSEMTSGVRSALSSTRTESPSTRCSMRPSDRRRVATVADGLIGLATSQVSRCSSVTCSMASASSVERLPSRPSDKRPRRLPPRRLAYQATPCRQIDSVPEMPAPSISTAAVGTAPVKSSFAWSLRAAALVIVTRMSCRRPPADQGVDINNRRRAGGAHICRRADASGSQSGPLISIRICRDEVKSYQSVLDAARLPPRHQAISHGPGADERGRHAKVTADLIVQVAPDLAAARTTSQLRQQRRDHAVVLVDVGLWVEDADEVPLI